MYIYICRICDIIWVYNRSSSIIEHTLVASYNILYCLVSIMMFIMGASNWTTLITNNRNQQKTHNWLGNNRGKTNGGMPNSREWPRMMTKSFCPASHVLSGKTRDVMFGKTKHVPSRKTIRAFPCQIYLPRLARQEEHGLIGEPKSILSGKTGHILSGKIKQDMSCPVRQDMSCLKQIMPCLVLHDKTCPFSKHQKRLVCQNTKGKTMKYNWGGVAKVSLPERLPKNEHCTGRGWHQFVLRHPH